MSQCVERSRAGWLGHTLKTAALFALASALALASCTAYLRQSSVAGDAVRAVSALPLRVARVDHDFTFRYCRDDCPQPTAKTLVPATAALFKLMVAQPAANEPLRLVSASSLPRPDSSEIGAATPFATTTVFFSIGAAELDAKARQILTQLAATAAHDALLRVVARTDSTGGAEWNDRLVKKRAQVVVDYLRGRLEPHDVEVHARGLCCYAATNATKGGRARNRRVEVTVHLRPES